MKRTILSLAFLLLMTPGFAQEEEVNTVGFRFLDYDNNYLPKTLLSERSVVIVNVPPKSKGLPIRGDWKALAQQFHPMLREAGIDATGYYYWDDVWANSDVTESFAETFMQRNIENIILLSKVQLKGDNIDDRYVVVITPFSGKDNIIANGQKAYKEQHKKLNRIGRKLERTATKSDIRKENNLIPEVPEFFEDTDLIEGKRSESYNVNLKLDKVAVPKFPVYDIPEDHPGGLINKNVEAEMREANKLNEKRNAKLKRIMEEHYPFDYELIDEVPENLKDLSRGNFQFVLMHIHSSGESVKKLLNYDPTAMNGAYFTAKYQDGKAILRELPKEADVHKYYMKHIYTNTIYLGEDWDADETWEEALINHLKNLVNYIHSH